MRDVGRFDVFVTAEGNSDHYSGRLNIIFELKIDSRVDPKQSKKYADWLQKSYPNDLNLLIYILPELHYDSKTTVGDERWYCMDYQLLHDKMLLPILEHPSLNAKVLPFVVQYIKNLRTFHNGVKMAITDEEKELALELYEKYSDVFDTIYDALKETNTLPYSTSDLIVRGRKSGRLVVKIGGHVIEGDIVRTLFKNVLVYLVDEQHLIRLPLPWGMTQNRYVVTNASTPVHPNGRDFFYPVEYEGYTLESHYARNRATTVLESLCKKLELDFESVEV